MPARHHNTKGNAYCKSTAVSIFCFWTMVCVIRHWRITVSDGQCFFMPKKHWMKKAHGGSALSGFCDRFFLCCRFGLHHKIATLPPCPLSRHPSLLWWRSIESKTHYRLLFGSAFYACHCGQSVCFILHPLVGGLPFLRFLLRTLRHRPWLFSMSCRPADLQRQRRRP